MTLSLNHTYSPQTAPEQTAGKLSRLRLNRVSGSAQPQFSGLADGLAARLPFIERGLTGFIGFLEGKQEFAATKLTQDLVSVYGPRVTASRSLPEAVEITFLELAENMMVYFGIGAIAKYLFLKPVSKLSQVAESTLKTNLGTLVKTLSKQELARVIPAKAALILGPLGIAAIGGEYSLAFLKNLLTLKVFKRKNYSDVVALSNGRASEEEDRKATRRSISRIAACGAVALSIGAAALVMAKQATKATKISKPLETFVRNMDFHFAKGHFEMTRAQLFVYMAVYVGAYMDSVRDSLERKEALSRLAIVIPNLLIGAELIQKGFTKLFGKGILKTIEGKTHILKNAEIEAFALQEARKTLHQFPNLSEEQLALKIARPLLNQKRLLFYIPHLINIFVIGLGTALVTRYFTKVRYQHAQARQEDQAQRQKLAAEPLRQSLGKTHGFNGYFHQVNQQKQHRHLATLA